MKKSLQWCLLIFGLLNLAYWAHLTLKAKVSQSRGAYKLDHQGVRTAPPATGDVVGRLEIPRLSLSTVVFEGDNEDVLDRGAGHLSNTVLPGEQGNAVLAAHRDTFFRPLRGVRVGDRVKIHGARKDSVYIVQSARVVQPDEVEVLKATREPVLTLITCYPFRFIGPAPERFVVRAILAR